MDRFSLTDAQWAKMKRFCLGKPTDPGRTGGDARLFTEAVLWIARTGSPWRDLPPSFGKWNTVFKRFRDWVKANVFQRMFDAVSGEPVSPTWNTNWIIDELNECGAKIVISQRPRRMEPLDIDLDVYKWRHLIENFFGKLKEFKRIAMRSDKTDTSFAAMITLGAAIINSR